MKKPMFLVKASAAVTAFFTGTWILKPVIAFAAATPTPISSMFDDFEEGGDGDIFKDVTKLVKEGGASIRSLIIAIAVVLFLISIVTAGIGLTKKDPNSRAQSKERIVYIILAAILVFGGMALLVFAQKVSGTISNALS